MIYRIFPTTIYVEKLNINLSKEQIDFFKSCQGSILKNEGNTTSQDNYILNNPILDNLKKEIELHLNHYFYDVMEYSNDASLYITQSWLNFSDNNQYHHAHDHPNSIIAGVFYINCPTDDDKISFLKTEYTSIKLNIKNRNDYNSNLMHLSVKNNFLTLFPSNLKHKVPAQNRPGVRVSLSFNTFVKGTLGTDQNLSRLVL
jgi:uncharacterized protein (TIGR02466 family)